MRSWADYDMDRKLQTTQRSARCSTSFNQYQLGFYWQDDIKVNNRLTIGVGFATRCRRTSTTS